MNLDCRVRDAIWADDSYRIQSVRHNVFTLEQGVSHEIVMDGKDAQCIHFLAENRSGDPVGCARLSLEGRVGRVAVLEKWRRSGVGAQIMNSLILHSESLGMSKTFLHSQLAVQSFYEYLGYKSEGPIFDEAGIPHVYMARRTNNA
ncbi:MAG: GNAT family N-acetyltransferase [Verrucomicrobiales bacterium]|nr:GNAT family N-acetyltransferase [Verrucomicrobiales bacterium]